jgi:hypothetical protein
MGGAPWWLRALFRTPFLDRFAYPLLVRRGFGALAVVDPSRCDVDAARAKGWRILPCGDNAPGSWRRLDDPDKPVG